MMMTASMATFTIIVLLLIVVGLATATGVLATNKKDDVSDNCGSGTHYSHIFMKCMPGSEENFYKDITGTGGNPP